MFTCTWSDWLTELTLRLGIAGRFGCGADEASVNVKDKTAVSPKLIVSRSRLAFSDGAAKAAVQSANKKKIAAHPTRPALK